MSEVATPSLLSVHLNPLFSGFTTFLVLLGCLDIAKDVLTDSSVVFNQNTIGTVFQAVLYALSCYMLCIPSFACKNYTMTCIIWTFWPIIFVHHFAINPILAIAYAGYGTAICLKMISLVKYGRDSTLSSFAYFLVAPTLCYQHSYPMTRHVDKQAVASYFAQFILCVHVLAKIVMFKLEPLVKKSAMSIGDQIDFSMYTMVAWIVGFYGFFHCHLNLVAELAMFKDRQFYSDWWNAESVQEFWQKWNVPMYKWFKTHITAKQYKRVIVFMVSAIMHEYLVAVATGKLHFWPMLAIMSQCPMLSASQAIMSRCGSRTLKNAFNWTLLLIFGPLTLRHIATQ